MVNEIRAMELTKERLIIAISGVIAIIAIGLYLFLFRPLINKLRLANIECKIVEIEATKAQELIASIKKLKSTKKCLILEEALPLAIDELTKEGRSKGINFVSITPRQIEKSKALPHRVCPIEIEIESTYEQLARFLGAFDELEKSAVTVRSFNIIPIKKGSSTLKTKLVVDTYLSN